jgi:hypothetical protein
MRAPGKLVRSSRWKTGPSKGQRPLGSECCVTPGDSGREWVSALKQVEFIYYSAASFAAGNAPIGVLGPQIHNSVFRPQCVRKSLDRLGHYLHGKLHLEHFGQVGGSSWR